MTICVPVIRGTTVISEKAIRRTVKMAVRVTPGTLNQSHALGRDHSIVSIDDEVALSSATTNAVSAVRIAVRAVVSWPVSTTEVVVRIRSSVATRLADTAGFENVAVDAGVDSAKSGHVCITRQGLAYSSDHSQLTSVRVSQQIVTAPQVWWAPEVRSIAVLTP